MTSLTRLNAAEVWTVLGWTVSNDVVARGNRAVWMGHSASNMAVPPRITVKRPGTRLPRRSTYKSCHTERRRASVASPDAGGDASGFVLRESVLSSEAAFFLSSSGWVFIRRGYYFDRSRRTEHGSETR